MTDAAEKNDKTPEALGEQHRKPIGYMRTTYVKALREGLQGSAFVYQQPADDLQPIYADLDVIRFSPLPDRR